MVAIDPKDKKYIITFKRKDLRPNKRDDKIEIFRRIVGLEDIRNIVDITQLTGNRKEEPLHKTRSTITDINTYETPFIFARLLPDQVNRLRKDPNVLLVEKDATYYAAAETQGWQIPKLKADTAWASPLSARGAGVNVSIIDTGVLPHLDFGPNLKINQNFTIRPGTGSEDAPSHHGTHVAGITGAAEGNNEGIQGVAPSCNIWNLRAGDHQGFFASSDMIEAVQYSSQNNAHVINMSISGGPFVQALLDALTVAYGQGIVIMGANGNTGQQETVRYPASYPPVIGISNLAPDNLPSPTSTFGTFTDFTCPGHDINSFGPNNTYHLLTGTSMATPAASGIAALMLSVYNDTGCPPYTPGAKKNQVIEAVLKDTASKTGLTGAGPLGQRDIFYGYGLPVADKAVAAMKGVIPPTTQEPTPTTPPPT